MNIRTGTVEALPSILLLNRSCHTINLRLKEIYQLLSELLSLQFIWRRLSIVFDLGSITSQVHPRKDSSLGEESWTRGTAEIKPARFLLFFFFVRFSGDKKKKLIASYSCLKINDYLEMWGNFGLPLLIANKRLFLTH